MNEELKNKLIENGLSEYIDMLEQQRLNTEDLLSELTQSDFEKIGINFIGDQKKMLKLFQKPEIVDAIAINSTPKFYEENDEKEKISQPIVINNASGDNSNAAHTGLAGILGGILGAVAVIVIILVILSNETFQL